ncbi:hypothetical protein J0X14_15240 [Muricauda sp. CAU 1633]|uniref:hypothetical protein n=1 Tax=Allomuricauda sp. CAU 1633 TaxID=2816036 RepID=UPI001A8E67A8|nr:hypothetical protein [Muricauda sp. CAU 1633]MBO0323663.1 hypothetical protein [Muricauda sp. CAU 1633]
MDNNDIVSLKRIINQTTSEVNFGTQLELLAADEKGDEIDVGLYPLCRFVSEKRGTVQFEIYGSDNIIRFPIEELERAIQAAKEWVQSEDSFDYPNES